jgi:hypothetical protein
MLGRPLGFDHSAKSGRKASYIFGTGVWIEQINLNKYFEMIKKNKNHVRRF